MGLNVSVLAGNLTRDPEVKYTPSGAAVCEFTIASNEKFMKDGQLQEHVNFVSVTVWGKQAEAVGQYLHKGDQATAEGKLRYDSWEKDGVKKSRLFIIAHAVHFGARANRNLQEPAAAPAAQERQEQGDAEYAESVSLPF